MKMRGTISLIAYMLAANAFTEPLFKVDFEEPTFTNGQAIVGGTAPSFPTDAALAVVSNFVLGFTSQAAMIYADYAGGGVEFETGVHSTGVHIISWEMVNIGGAFNGQTTIDDSNIFLSYTPGTPKAFQLWNVITNDPPTFPPDRHPIIENAANLFSITFDLDNDEMSFSFNGDVIVERHPIAGEATLSIVRFWQNTSIGSEVVCYGLDNFRWEVVNHPQMLPTSNGYLSWSSESGMTYHVQNTSDLSKDKWTNLISEIVATGAVTIVEYPFEDASFEALRTTLEIK
jgi:hypothetical protein